MTLQIKDLGESYWTNRYEQGQTGWDAGAITTPLKEYFDQLPNKAARILIPGAGNGYEAVYLHQQGFTNVFVADLSAIPLQNIKAQAPTFPQEHLLQQDFFTLTGTFDYIIEQTFFCALHPDLRTQYAQKMHELLAPNGHLAGVLFNAPLFTDHPPYGGNPEQYRPVFEPLFTFKAWQECYNSIKPRAGREWWINLTR